MPEDNAPKREDIQPTQEQVGELGEVLKALLSGVDPGDLREQAIHLRDSLEQTLGITPEERMEFEAIEKAYAEIMEEDADPPELMGISETALDLVVKWSQMEANALVADDPRGSTPELMFTAGLTAGIATGLRLARNRAEATDG
jgi:hypothetical protein